MGGVSANCCAGTTSDDGISDSKEAVVAEVETLTWFHFTGNRADFREID